MRFIGVTSVNNIVQVPGVQFYNITSYIVLCAHHKKSPTVTLYLIPFILFTRLPQ